MPNTDNITFNAWGHYYGHNRTKWRASTTWRRSIRWDKASKGGGNGRGAPYEPYGGTPYMDIHTSMENGMDK
jgi:hypothetical protein